MGSTQGCTSRFFRHHHNVKELLSSVDTTNQSLIRFYVLANTGDSLDDEDILDKLAKEIFSRRIFVYYKVHIEKARDEKIQRHREKATTKADTEEWVLEAPSVSLSGAPAPLSLPTNPSHAEPAVDVTAQVAALKAAC